MASKKKASTAVEVVPETTHEHPRITFIKSVKFAGIGLDKSQTSVDRGSLAKAHDEEDELEVEVTIRQSVLAHTQDYFVIASDFDLSQRTKSSDKAVVSISATFSARFDLTKRASENLVSAFAELEARLIFFPYLRHFVSDISYRMGIVPIVLPMTSEFER